MKLKLFLFGTGLLILFWISACKEIEDPAPEIKSKWKVFTTKDGLSSDTIWSIEKTSTSEIWIGTQKGLCKFNNGVISKDYSNITPYSLQNSSLGLLIGCDKGSLILMNNALFYADEMVMGKVIDVILDEQQYIWSAPEKGGVYLNGYLMFKNYIVNDLFSDKSYVWISTIQGLLRISDTETKLFKKENGLDATECNVAFRDSKDRSWVGTSSSLGLSQILDGEIINYEFPYIKSIAEDHEGNLWLGSTKFGVFKWETNGNRINYTMLDGLPSNRITKVMVATDNSVWVATEDSGIAMLKE